MGLRLVVSVLFGVGWIASQGGTARAGIVTNKDDSGDGSLRAQIIAANADTGSATVITFAADVTGTITLALPLPTVTHAITLTGPGADKLTIDGSAATGSAVFTIGNARVSISKLTIRGGSNEPGNGGGISVGALGALTLTDSVITGNAATQGGGIYSAGASLLIKTSTISSNTGDAALYLATTAAAEIVDSTIADNDGTAVIFNPATTDIILSMNRVTVSGNTGGADQIGGLQLQGGEATLTNSTFSGNTGDVGGDFWTFASGVALTLVNVTAVSDSSPSLRVEADTTVSLLNTLLAGTGPRCTGAPTSLGHNLATDASCNLSLGSDKPSADPHLGPLAANGGATQTHALLAGSAALDAADPSGLDDVDQRGYPRVQFAGPDIGAVEVTEPVITQQPTPQQVTEGHALTLTIVAQNQNSATPLGYQWRRDATPIAGATSATFTKSAALDDAGSYDVLVINDGGSMASAAVAVTVTAAPPTPDGPSGGGGSGGCCSANGAGAASSGALALVIAVMLGYPRRRRRHDPVQ